MKLVTQLVTNTTYMTGFDSVAMKEGEVALIYAPKDSELLLAEVPKGKKWTISISVEVYETDA
jgi:hypothetical protein